MANPAGRLERIVAKARRHPLLLVEHCVLAILVAMLVTRSVPPPCRNPALHRGEGPLDVFSLDEVEMAPAPTLLVEQSGIAQHTDARGEIARVKPFSSPTAPEVNFFFTKKGGRRAGSLHNCTQYSVVLQGSARVTTADLATGRQYERTYGPNQLIGIPARVPHLFTFEEDTTHLEWWGCAFQAWYYKPFRESVDSGGGSGG